MPGIPRPVDPNEPPGFSSGQLHPELQRIQEVYDRLIDDVSSNAMSYDDAVAMLDKIGTFDASGYRWSLDADGNFVRQASPEAAKEICDPARFSSAKTGSGPRPIPSPSTPRPQSQATPSPDFAQDFPEPSDPEDRPKRKSSSSSEPPQFFVKANDFFQNNKVTVIVVAVCVALVVAVLMTRGSSAPPATTLPSGSSVPGQSTQLPSSSTKVTSPTIPTTLGPSTTIPSAPPGARVSEVTAALVSGKKDQVSAVIVDPGTAGQNALNTSLFAGFDPTGIQIVPQTALASTPGAATQVWLLVDKTTQAPFGQATVSWVFKDGHWLLVGWPNVQSTDTPPPTTTPAPPVTEAPPETPAPEGTP